MRRFPVFVAAVCAVVALDSALASETGPVIVIPGRPGVPVIIDGRDASYAVVEGDWGLNRPSQTDPRIIYRYGNPPHWFPDSSHYFPSAGRPPKVGRQEVDAPRAPQPDEGYIRSWSTQSDPTPATSPTDFQMPPVIVDDPRRGWRR